MSDNLKKLSSLELGFVLGLGIVATLGLAGALLTGRGKNGKDKYLVVDKGSKTVIYAPLANKNDMHILQFNESDKYSFIYDNVNIGDTIYGIREYLNVPVARPAYNGIQTVNGKTLQELRGLKQKQR